MTLDHEPNIEIDSDNIIWIKPNDHHLDFFKYKNCRILRDVY